MSRGVEGRVRLRALLVLALAALFAGDARAQGAERLFWVDVELEGPLDAVELDAGEDGGTRLAVRLLSGERRSLSLPVPARSPLGLDGLERRPLPSGVPIGAGVVRVLGWSERQPTETLALLPPALRARALPAVGASRRHAGRAALALLACAFAGAFLLRARPRAAAALGLALATALGLLGARARERSAPVTVFEADLAQDLWVELRAARDELAGPFDSLSLRPDGPVWLDGDAASGPGTAWVARAEGAVLYGRRRLTPDGLALAAGANGLAAFDTTHVRSAEGIWSAHGPWLPGEPLAPARPAPADEVAPPGWLGAGLPAGVTVFVGRLGDGRWVRASGLAVPPETLESR